MKFAALIKAKTSKKFKRDESIGQLELRFEKETERQKNAI